jgi:hypothetical protein
MPARIVELENKRHGGLGGSALITNRRLQAGSRVPR